MADLVGTLSRAHFGTVSTSYFSPPPPTPLIPVRASPGPSFERQVYSESMPMEHVLPDYLAEHMRGKLAARGVKAVAGTSLAGLRCDSRIMMYVHRLHTEYLCTMRSEKAHSVVSPLPVVLLFQVPFSLSYSGRRPSRLFLSPMCHILLLLFLSSFVVVVVAGIFGRRMLPLTRGRRFKTHALKKPGSGALPAASMIDNHLAKAACSSAKSVYTKLAPLCTYILF